MSADYRDWNISRLDLPPSCYRPLRILGIHTLGDLAGRTRGELLKMHRVGPKSLEIIEARMAAAGLSLTPGLTDRRAPAATSVETMVSNRPQHEN